MKHIEIPKITVKVDWQALNKLNLANAIFNNTEIEELANYPKKPTTKF